MIDGKQCTVTWYVDDIKISHVDKSVVTSIIDKLQNEYGDFRAMRGNHHKLLGMEVNFMDDKTVTISTIDHVKDAIRAFTGELKGKISNPANRNLFNVNPDLPRIDKDRADIFHSIVAKLLWLMKRGRPDIETVISFLCTRVCDPNEGDWMKLRRVLLYLSNIVNDIRVIGVDDLKTLVTMVDASYAVHPNMRSHTGGLMTFGRGILHGKSSKQKLNTKSSTESELVGVSEYLPYSLWMANFLKCQNYKLLKNTVYQDNQSTLRMARNGRN